MRLLFWVVASLSLLSVHITTAQQTFTQIHYFPDGSSISYPEGWEGELSLGFVGLDGDPYYISVMDYGYFRSLGYDEDSALLTILEDDFTTVYSDSYRFDPSAVETLEIDERE